MATHTKTLIDAFILRKKLLAVLGQKIGANKTTTSRTKADALVEAMVAQAMEDPRVATQIFKLVAEDKETAPETVRSSKADWESLFAFFGKYKPLIEQEIARLNETNPSYWSFDWCTPTLETAPWYKELHETTKE